MEEVRSRPVIGMLPGSNSMSIASIFVHMIVHNANAGKPNAISAALEIFLLGSEERVKVCQVLSLTDAEVEGYLNFLGVWTRRDVEDRLAEILSLCFMRLEGVCVCGVHFWFL